MHSIKGLITVVAVCSAHMATLEKLLSFNLFTAGWSDGQMDGQTGGQRDR